MAADGGAVKRVTARRYVPPRRRRIPAPVVEGLPPRRWREEVEQALAAGQGLELRWALYGAEAAGCRSDRMWRAAAALKDARQENDAMIDADEMRRFRVVGYDPKLFTAVDVIDAPGVAGWKCKHCGRLFVGSSAGNGAGFAHDCEFPLEVVYKDLVADRR